MNKKKRLPGWLAPIIGGALPVGMAMVGQFKQDHSLLAIWEVDPERLILMVGLGIFGGAIIWVYDVVKRKIDKRRTNPE